MGSLISGAAHPYSKQEIACLLLVNIAFLPCSAEFRLIIRILAKFGRVRMQLTVHKRKTWRLSAIILAVLAAVSIPLAIQLRSASAVATSATINGSTRAIDGTNTWRGTNQMIMYTYSSSQTSVPTAMSNQWGIEVAVSASGVITAKNDRLSSGSTTGTCSSASPTRTAPSSSR